jgi:hypothetical protein
VLGSSARLLERDAHQRIELSGFHGRQRTGRLARREWDSNPRWVAPHTLSKRADSAALASLQ